MELNKILVALETSKESLQLVMNCACLFEMKSHETAWELGMQADILALCSYGITLNPNFNFMITTWTHTVMDITISHIHLTQHQDEQNMWRETEYGKCQKKIEDFSTSFYLQQWVALAPVVTISSGQCWPVLLQFLWFPDHHAQNMFGSSLNENIPQSS